MTSLASPTPDRLRVDIWSDIACPWCYIGKRRFERALADFPHRDQVDVVWHSFELDPGAAERNPLGMRDALAAKYRRTPAQAQDMMDGVAQAAAGEGLNYRLDDAKLVNTARAHALLHLAAERGVQDRLKETLLDAYFTQGADLSDPDTLVTLAQSARLDAGEARAALTDEARVAAVRRDEAQAAALGITGVPFFVLGGKYGVSGAQDRQTFLGALNQVWQETHPAPLTLLGSDTADGCEDGSCAVPARQD